MDRHAGSQSPRKRARGSSTSAPLWSPVFVGGHSDVSWLALVDQGRHAVEKAAYRVDQRSVRRAIGLGHAVESAKDQARPVDQQPFRQGRIMVRPLVL